MGNRRLMALASVAALILGACSGGATASPTAAPTENQQQSQTASQAPSPTATPAAAGCTVGVSWNNFQEPRWAKWDEPAIKAAIAAGGGTYISTDAKSSATTQLGDVDTLISKGAKAIIILAQDGQAILPAVQKALDAGIPVIAYDRLIENNKALYITFDNVEVGRMQARAVFAAQPKGNYAIIKGSPTDANANFLRSGIEEIIGAAVKSGDIKIVGETYTDNWDSKKAGDEMATILSKNNNKVDAVISENDGMAIGVVSSLNAVGLAGKVPVSGQDGDLANLNNVAKGLQTVDVWKDARELGKAAGDAAIALCGNGGDLTKVANTIQFESPKKNKLTSILLKPQPITQENLNVVLDAKWITKDVLCAGVDAAKAPAACK